MNIISRKSLVTLASLAAACTSPSSTPAPQPAAILQTAGGLSERAVRRDIPLTNMIRHALALGTRDSTGRPGRNYWQLWMDYTINARLEPSTSMLTGRERIVLHNTSDTSLTTIQMRLDQNIFRGDVPRGASVPAEN